MTDYFSPIDGVILFVSRRKHIVGESRIDFRRSWALRTEGCEMSVEVRVAIRTMIYIRGLVIHLLLLIERRDLTPATCNLGSLQLAEQFRMAQDEVILRPDLSSNQRQVIFPKAVIVKNCVLDLSARVKQIDPYSVDCWRDVPIHDSAITQLPLLHQTSSSPTLIDLSSSTQHTPTKATTTWLLKNVQHRKSMHFQGTRTC